MDNNTHGAPHDGARGDARKRRVEGPSDFDALREYAEAERERANKAEANAREYKAAWKRTWRLANHRAKGIFQLQGEKGELRERAEKAEELYRDASVRLDEQRKMTDEAEARADVFMDGYERTMTSMSDTEAALADLRERVRALAEEWERYGSAEPFAWERLRALLDGEGS